MRYFSEIDFKQANPSCSMEDMDKNFLIQLDNARHLSGIPYIINSAFRSISHEKSRGRDGSSTHTLGKAVDIRVRNSRERFHILRGLIEAGFRRIGVANTFIHVDSDPVKDKDVIWTYS